MLITVQKMAVLDSDGDGDGEVEVECEYIRVRGAAQYPLIVVGQMCSSVNGAGRRVASALTENSGAKSCDRKSIIAL